MSSTALAAVGDAASAAGRGANCTSPLYAIERAGSTVRVRAVVRLETTQNIRTRGRVRTFTAAARARMLWTAHRIKWFGQRTRFVTLTYERAVSHPQAKRDLDVWFKRLRRRWPKAWALWRVERTKAGRLHIHAIVGGTGFIPQAWLQMTWAELTSQAIGMCHIRAVQGTGQALGYVVKYAAKSSEVQEGEWELTDATGPIVAMTPPEAAAVDTSLDFAAYLTAPLSDPEATWISESSTGRWWGLLGRAHVPWHEVEKYMLLGTPAVGRVLYAIGRARSDYYTWGQGMRVFGGHGRDLRRALEREKARQGWRVHAAVRLTARIRHTVRNFGRITLWDKVEYERANGQMVYLDVPGDTLTLSGNRADFLTMLHAVKTIYDELS